MGVLSGSLEWLGRELSAWLAGTSPADGECVSLNSACGICEGIEQPYRFTWQTGQAGKGARP